MGFDYKIHSEEDCHFLTLTVVSWVDLFTRKSYRDILIESLKYCQDQKGLEIFGFVIMSNHIHLLARSSTGNLSGTIRDFKSFTAKEMIKISKSEKESRRDWLEVVFKFNARFN